MSIRLESACKGCKLHSQITKLALFMTSVGFVANGQEASEMRSTPQPLSTRSLRKAPGRLLSKGVNQTSVGALKVKTFRLEEVALPAPIETGSGDSTDTTKTAIRLTVTLDSFLNGPYAVWINDDAHVAVPTKDGELTTLFLAPVSLENGARLTVSSGTGCNMSLHSTLPETLAVPKRLRRSVTENAGNFIRSIRSVPETLAKRPQAGVKIELATSVRFPIRNDVMVLQIGNEEFEMDPDRPGEGTLVFTLTAEQFAHVPEGGRVKVKYGRCSFGGVRFGRLDKRLLDR